MAINNRRDCLVVLNGVVKNAYYVEEWMPDHNVRDNRYEFTRKEEGEDIENFL